jgi:hypothetical protein
LLDWPFGGAKAKRGKQAFEHPIVDKSLEKHEEEGPRVGSSSKEFLALMDAFFVFVVQKGETITQNQETNQANERHCGKFGCHKQCPKWGFYQGNHQSKVIRCGEGDQNQMGAPMVAPSGGIDENPMP